MRKLISLCLLMIGLSSCSRYTNHKYEVIFESGDTIYVTAYTYNYHNLYEYSCNRYTHSVIFEDVWYKKLGAYHHVKEINIAE